MKKILSLLVFIPFVCAGCGITSIVTETPYSGSRTSYRTTVRSNRTNSITTNVYAANEDISLYLDLQGVAAAFSQASTVKEFESLLNDSSYMLSDLDLNGDGYVDYLRVLETLDGSTHVFLIQAVLGEDVYQDVATLVAEVPTTSTYHVQVIGAPFLYGPDYIIEPVYYTRPAIFVSFGVRAYVAWSSPWHWNYYPTYYTRPVPVHIGHYHAYIDTYMRNHKYCHNVTYVNVYHYINYNVVCRNVQRNDYIVKHPERSFDNRVSYIRGGKNAGTAPKPINIRNAKDIRDLHDANKKTTTNSRSQYRRSGNINNGNNGNISGTNNGNIKRGRQINNDNGLNNNKNVQSGRTYNKGRMRDGNSETTQKNNSSVINKNKSTQRSTGNSTNGKTTYNRSKSSQSAAQSSKASTTVTSRVKKSGAANTKVNKVSNTGEKTTYRRK